jgi:hypothetical protein
MFSLEAEALLLGLHFPEILILAAAEMSPGVRMLGSVGNSNS